MARQIVVDGERRDFRDGRTPSSTTGELTVGRSGFSQKLERLSTLKCMNCKGKLHRGSTELRVNNVA